MNNVFSSFRMSKKLGVVFLALLAMMGIGGSVGLYNATQITSVTDGLYTDYFVRIESLSSIEKELLGDRQDVFLYTIAHDTASMSYIESSLAAHDKKIKQLLAQHLESETQGTRDTRERELFISFEKTWSDYKEMKDNAISLSSKSNTAALALVKGDLQVRFKHAMEALHALLAEEKNDAFSKYQRAGYFSKIITWMTLSLTIAAIIISVGLWSILTSSIVKPIEVLEESAKKIADGNLKERASVLSEDEIGDLATEFNKMAEYLEGYYATLEKKVEERTETIMAANEELFRKKQEMEIMNEELIKANKMKSQFLANISHELRTPLNSIMGFSELLKEKSFGELNEKQTQYVNYIHTSGSHILHLINNILDLSKIEAGRLELEPEEFPLADVIGEVLGSIRPLAHKKGVVVESKTTPISPIVKLDRQKFKQIMLNLLSNAVKFNREGGRVHVDWNISAEPKGTGMEKALSISVKDTGIGIQGNDIPRVFKEFEQLDPSITREYGGTGLGLALTKRLVELHSGRIWLESEYGKGSTFNFVIPQGGAGLESEVMHTNFLKDTTAKDYYGHEALSAAILVASESQDMNELIKTYLTQNGYDVKLAVDGVDLIKKANQIKPFAIILGIALPKKDGWEVLRELKASPDTCEIPTVIVSSSNNKELGFSLGAVDYLVKPVNKDKLLSTLDKLSFTTKLKRHPFSILVIDDEPQVLEFLGDILEKEGFGVLKATNGEEGIALAIERDPDLIILDLMMPRVSGFDVVYHLKKHPTAKDIPIVIFTAKGITAADKEELGDGIANILRKADFSKIHLLNEIKKLEMMYPIRANMIDPLTRVFNHRYFNYWIVQEIARGKRYGLSFAMIMIDVDRQQDYNTKHGLLLGHEMLVDLARLIDSNIRKADCLIRYSGDEFLVVLPNINKEAASAVAEKLGIRVGSHGFPSSDGKKNGRITVSIGVVGFPVDGKDSKELILNINKTVKSAFQSGGNKVVVFKKTT